MGPSRHQVIGYTRPAKTNQEKIIEDEFLTIIKKYNGAIVNSIQAFPHINFREDREDYYQEILMRLWIGFVNKITDGGFEKTENGIIHYGGWIKKVAYNCIVEILRSRSKKNADILCFHDTDFSFIPAGEPEYTEDNFVSLKIAIENLKPEDQTVIQMVLDGKDLRKESLQIGMAFNYYGNKLSLILKKLRNSARKYFENLFVPSELLEVRENTKLHNVSTRIKVRPIVQYDLWGNLLSRWPSLGEASRNGFDKNGIRRALQNEKYTYKGTKWFYDNDEQLEMADGCIVVKQKNVMHKMDSKWAEILR